MNEHPAREPVRLYAPEDRERTLAFLQLVDHKFVPPLSSKLRYGSLEAYLDVQPGRRARPCFALRTGRADHRVPRLSVRTR